MPLPAFLDNDTDRKILAELQAFNQKHIERADEEYQDLGTIKIFNVGPSVHSVSMGGQGTFTVKACPEERTYSEPLELWKMYPEGRNEDMNKMIEILTNGYALAEGIVSYGKFCTPSSDLRKFGVFTCGAFVTVQAPDAEPQVILASELKKYQKDRRGTKIIQTRKVTKVAIQAARKNGDERDESEIRADILASNLPTEAELEDAHNRLNQYCLQLVEEANAFYRAGSLAEIQALHRWAAIRTGNSGLPWVAGSLLMTKCEVCGNSLSPDVAICLGCKTIVSGKEEIIKAKRVPGYEWLWKEEIKPQVAK